MFKFSSYPGKRKGKQRPLPSRAPPPITNASAWFDHYDSDRSGSLDREEVVSALVQTLSQTGNTKSPESVRETVYSIWSAFDGDGSGYIDKREFVAPGGLGESLQAMTQNDTNANAQGYGGQHHTYVPKPPQDYMQPSAPPFPQGETETMRVPIPSGMQPGQKLKVRSESGETIVLIPEYAQWKSENERTYFHLEIPTVNEKKPMIVQGTFVPNQNKGHYNYYDHSPPPATSTFPSNQAAAIPWQSWNQFTPHRYVAPPLRMTSVPIHNTRMIQPSGRRKAFLVGINYKNTRAQLRGCANDAYNMKDLLLQQGFQDDPTHMVMLVDDPKRSGYGHSNSTDAPTRSNIIKGLQWLVQGASSGDVLFFHFSGHGAQVPDKTGIEADGFNETILPVDYKNAGMITDDEIWGSIVGPLPSGVKLAAIMDCCHSGTGMDLPFEFQLNRGMWEEDINPAHCQGDVVLFSGCKDSQTSADVTSASTNQSGGAMTNSFIQAYRAQNSTRNTVTYMELMKAIHKQLKQRGFTQRPQLTSSQRINVHTKVFSFVDNIEPNVNREVGRQKSKHIKAGKAGGKMSGGVNDLLFGVAAVAGLGALMDIFS